MYQNFSVNVCKPEQAFFCYETNALHHLVGRIDRDLTILGSCFKLGGMQNIRPAGQMWPAEALNLARLAQNYVLLAYFLDRCTL